MAQGGTCIYPFADYSIYTRALDAHYYSPDLIILYAGQNDPMDWWVSASNPGTTALEKVRNEATYTSTETLPFPSEWTTLGCYKGMIEQLQATCPDAQLVLVAHMPVYCKIGMNPTSEFADSGYPSPRFASLADVEAFESELRYPKVELILALGEYYDVPVVNLWEDSGVTDENAEEYYGEVAGDCTQVHPNAAGYLLMAKAIYRKLISL